MTKKLIYFFSVYFLLGACREVGWEEHYQRPEWLKGNAGELLETRGEFSLFLEGG
ncbi:hypothetical protein QWY93_09000 [Echinicola jeungdonensis]|uniref:Uncharacterized protein n=1 Tax=Echinicola jeungdonensis TaxID=709343 RepID=A0ABV5J8E8_9BACT|nr:hypothetical protein [Echinicola jeungdonensis]MDN3669467.1 hypothetical protein [Echinicola jeungdonensis]